MKLQRTLLFMILLFTIGYACTDDEGSITNPSLSVQGNDFVKPDSTIILEVTVVIPGLLEVDGLGGEVVSGEGTLVRTTIQGENTAAGSGTFEFTAGNTENSSSLLKFAAVDRVGQIGVVEFEIDITSLEINQVLIFNEGNFFSANGSIDVMDIKTNRVDPAVYQATATVQQATHYQEKIYLVTNAPDRLDILSESLDLEESIEEGLDNPIDFAAIGEQGYISNWGDINTAFSENPDSYIAIVDLTNNTVVDSVLLDARPQGLLAYDDKIYIANEGGETVSVLDPSDLSLEEVQVPAGPSDLVLDASGMIWVICTSGNLVEIDPSDLSVGAEINDLTTGGFNEKMTIDGTGNFIYFLGGSNNSFTGLTTVYHVDLNTTVVTPFVEDGFAFYGIGVNPESNHVYVGDSNAFQSTGTGFRYDNQGNKLDEFATGIGPRGFLFK